MITAKCLHVFNFKRLDEQVFKSQQRQRIFNFKTQYKSSHEVCCFLKTRVVGIAGGFLVWLSDLDLLGFDVVADLKLQLLDDGAEDLQPVLLQRRDSKTTKTFEIAHKRIEVSPPNLFTGTPIFRTFVSFCFLWPTLCVDDAVRFRLVSGAAFISTSMFCDLFSEEFREEREIRFVVVSAAEGEGMMESDVTWRMEICWESFTSRCSDTDCHKKILDILSAINSFRNRNVPKLLNRPLGSLLCSNSCF